MQAEAIANTPPRDPSRRPLPADDATKAGRFDQALTAAQARRDASPGESVPREAGSTAANPEADPAPARGGQPMQDPPVAEEACPTPPPVALQIDALPPSTAATIPANGDAMVDDLAADAAPGEAVASPIAAEAATMPPIQTTTSPTIVATVLSTPAPLVATSPEPPGGDATPRLANARQPQPRMHPGAAPEARASPAPQDGAGPTPHVGAIPPSEAGPVPTPQAGANPAPQAGPGSPVVPSDGAAIVAPPPTVGLHVAAPPAIQVAPVVPGMATPAARVVDSAASAPSEPKPLLETHAVRNAPPDAQAVAGAAPARAAKPPPPAAPEATTAAPPADLPRSIETKAAAPSAPPSPPPAIAAPPADAAATAVQPPLGNGDIRVTVDVAGAALAAPPTAAPTEAPAALRPEPPQAVVPAALPTPPSTITATERPIVRPPRQTPAGQIAPVAIALSLGGEAGGAITVSLDPIELGRVDVRVERMGDLATVQVVADRPETLQLLQRDHATLDRALAEAGIGGGGRSLSFSLGGEGRGGQERPRRPSGAAMTIAGGPGPAPDQRGASRPRALLDIAV
ncbi:flagellar hook-length control protein FliK [Humitalea sp. 24SJ18S-53]|uniref:flagellar hook-length control protein FliK n=1 Tax=Humitalea sp. 24SJ18S-53 TaxID=3422307 RepID=UPI003D664540